MLPKSLHAGDFAQYPPQAGRLAAAHVATLQELPLSFLPGLLRELIEYDYKFPAEQASIRRELDALSALSDTQRNAWFQGFSSLRLSAQLEDLDWVNQPSLFVEQESAYLWTTRQLDAFSTAATAYGERLRAAAPPEALPVRRLGIAVIGQGVTAFDGSLFQNLRTHGTYFSQVQPEDGLNALLAAVGARSKANPLPYAHWYVDGGDLLPHSTSLTTMSYAALQPIRSNLLKYMQAEIARPGMGPEQLRTDMARLQPADLGMSAQVDPVLARFQMKIFTEGSGTQIFSTTFAQWTAREALRRAQPLTLLVRFAPRQRQRPMSDLLSDTSADPALDFTGSLIDADMGAYYHWINQQRLPGAIDAAFLVWFEGHSQALVVAPTMPRGAQSDSKIDLSGLLRLATS